MSVHLYLPDFSNRYEIRHAISMQTSENYCGTGKITLVLPVSDYNIRAVQTGGFLYDTDSDTAYWIVSVKSDTGRNRLTANGYTTDALLNKRALIAPATIKNVETDVYAAISANLRGLSVELSVSKGLTETTDAVLNGGQLLDAVTPILNAADLGYRMRWNPDTLMHTFEIYKGRDMTSGNIARVFSEEQGTAKNLVINDDISTFKNFAYIPSVLKDDTEIVETYGTAEGNDRDEIWLDSAPTIEENETESEYRIRLKTYGAQELTQRIRRQSFSVSIRPEEYASIYRIGDLVSCVSIRFGVQFTARITGAKHTLDVNGKNTSLTLGDPVLIMIGGTKVG